MRRIVFSLFLLWSASLPAQDVPLETLRVEPTRVARELILDGVIEAVEQSTASSEVAARVVEIGYDVGDFVPKGEVVIRFRDTEQRAQLTQAQASLKEAAARERQARQDYERVKSVFAKQLVSQAEMDRATEDLKAATARLEAARAAVEEAEERLSKTVIRAPYSGIVVERHVEVGEMANPGQPLIEGFSLETLRAVVDVPQRYIDTIRSLRQSRIVVDTRDGHVIESQRMTFFPYADERSHTFRVRVDFAAEDVNLYPGMLVKVAFAIGERERLLVPASALVFRSEVTALYVVGADGRVTFRHVRIGRRHPHGKIEVIAGLEAGERIALDPIRAGVSLKQQRESAG